MPARPDVRTALLALLLIIGLLAVVGTLLAQNRPTAKARTNGWRSAA